MNRLILVFAVFISYSPHAYAKTWKFTLTTILKHALDVSRRQLTAPKQVKAREWSVYSQRWHLNPTLNAKVQIMDQEHRETEDKLYEVSISESLPFGPRLTLSDAIGRHYLELANTGNKEYVDGHRYTASASFPLLKGFGTLANQHKYRKERLYLKKDEHSFISAIDTQLFNVCFTYMYLRYDQMKRNVSQRALNNTLKRKNKIRRLVRNGEKAPTDLLSIDKEVIRLRVQMIERNAQYNRRLNQMKRYLRIRANDTIFIQLALQPLERMAKNKYDLRKLFQGNHGLAKRYLDMQIANIDRKYSFNQMLPSLRLLTQGRYFSTNEALSHKTDWSVSLNFSTSLNYFVKRASYKKTVTESAMARIRYENDRQSLALDLDDAQIELRSLAQKKRLEFSAVHINRKKLAVVEKNYFDGSQTVEQLFIEQSNYEIVQINAYRSRIDYLIAYLRILRETGNLRAVLGV